MEKFEGLNVPVVTWPVMSDSQERRNKHCDAAVSECNFDCTKCIFDYENAQTLPAFLRWEESQKNE